MKQYDFVHNINDSVIHYCSMCAGNCGSDWRYGIAVIWRHYRMRVTYRIGHQIVPKEKVSSFYRAPFLFAFGDPREKQVLL